MEIEMEHSKYKIDYDNGVVKIYRFDEDVTNLVMNNVILDLCIEIEKLQDKYKEAISKANKYDELEKYNSDLIRDNNQLRTTLEEKPKVVNINSVGTFINNKNKNIEQPQKSSTQMFEELDIHLKFKETKKQPLGFNKEVWKCDYDELSIIFNLDYKKTYISALAFYKDVYWYEKLTQAIRQREKEKGWLE